MHKTKLLLLHGYNVNLKSIQIKKNKLWIKSIFHLYLSPFLSEKIVIYLNVFYVSCYVLVSLYFVTWKVNNQATNMQNEIEIMPLNKTYLL